MKEIKVDKTEGTFTFQSDKFKDQKFRCYFNARDFNRNIEWWFDLDRKHLNLLPPIFRAIGSYGKYRDDPSNIEPLKDKLIFLIEFSDNGIRFKSDFYFDLTTGEVIVDLGFNGLIVNNEFTIPVDMPSELKDIISGLSNKSKWIDFENIKDHMKMLNYIIEKYFDRFKDFIYYLETLNEPLCDSCSYLSKKNLSLGVCKEDYMFIKNKYDTED